MSGTTDLQLICETETANRLGISRRTLRRWTAAGLIPSLRLRGRRLYDVRDLERVVAAAKSTEPLTDVDRPIEV